MKKNIFIIFFVIILSASLFLFIFANPRNEDNALITKNNAEKVNKNSSKSELEESITKVNNQKLLENEGIQYTDDELKGIAQAKLAFQKYSREEIEEKPYLLAGLSEADMGISYYSIDSLDQQDRKEALKLLHNLKTVGNINGKVTTEFQREDDSTENLQKIGGLQNLKLQFDPVKLDKKMSYKLTGINTFGGIDKSGNSDSNYQLYVGSNGSKIEFTEQYAPIGGNVQIKQVKEFINTKVNQNDAIFEHFDSDNIVNIHWQNNNRYYSVSTKNMSSKEAFAVAEKIDFLSSQKQL